MPEPNEQAAKQSSPYQPANNLSPETLALFESFDQTLTGFDEALTGAGMKSRKNSTTAKPRAVSAT
ncbi:MAG: hypothetical protein HC805_07995 [Alkalinema sp. RL_2_19]|nr:hypothetical protein [Alkalinema sp. RL_2_19]